MDRERWEQVRQIFDHLADKSPSHRSDYLDIVCENDPSLRSEVEQLLAANDTIENDESPGFLSGAPESPRPGSVGDYAIGDLLGEGGMGAVYEAEHPRYGRVALKLLPAFLVENETAAARFRNEAAVLERLRHPGLCVMHESFVADGYAGIAMELVSGDELEQIIAAGPLGVSRAVAMIRSLAEALAVAHAQSVYHRDIKPGNVIVPREPGATPKLIDFGIAKFADVRLTATGQAIGSPRYMSPEQWRGARVDARTDLWSLGVVWYEMLTGRRPFDGQGLAEIAAAVVRADFAPLPERDPRDEPLTPSAAIIARLLRKDPAERIGSCAELIGMLDAF